MFRALTDPFVGRTVTCFPVNQNSGNQLAKRNNACIAWENLFGTSYERSLNMDSITEQTNTGAQADLAGPCGSGVPGLDGILAGGFPRSRMYLIEGDPGAGKTTLALQFLLEGVRNGEPGLYVALSETAEELRQVADSHGWSLEGITICDLADSEESLRAEAQYTLFHPSEVELSETTQVVLEAVEKHKPRRIVFDSLSEMRLLARDPLRYRRQVLSLKQYFAERGTTVLLLDYQIPPTGDRQVQSLTHGVIRLEQLASAYGTDRRRLRVQKLRGVGFRGGYHDFVISKGGLEVFPRLLVEQRPNRPPLKLQRTGVETLDTLLGGGLHTGTSTLIMGPAGVGKSTLAAQIGCNVIREHGGRAAFFIFDELPDMLVIRGSALGIPIEEGLREGRILLRHINPAELSPGAFAHLVKQNVTEQDVRVVVIDSLNGYRTAMPDEGFLSAHLHELLAFLNQAEVLTLLVMAQHGIVGEGVESPVELSYLADSVILLRYFETRSEVRQAISVVKRRTGSHERSIREMLMDAGGLRLGEPLREFDGILTGRLSYNGSTAPLLEDRSHQ
jgi:circadian clock protein KaiC